MMDFQAVRWLTDGEVPPQAGNDHPTMMPTGVFPTSDGYLNIQATSNALFRKLCDALGAADVLSNPSYAAVADRSKNRRALVDEIAEYTKRNTTAHWLETLNAAGIPCGPIYTVDKTFADPQVQHVGMVMEAHQPRLGDLHLLTPPYSLSESRPRQARMPAPEHSQHTDAVLAGLGYDAEAIADLRQRHIV
jgi:formyl-CoA transferase